MVDHYEEGNTTTTTRGNDPDPVPTGNGNPTESSSPQDERNYFEDAIEMGKLSYAAASFNAIVKPVFFTMVLSALAVIFISTPESRKTQQEGLANSYTVLQGETSTSGQQLGQSLINGLVIVGVICTMTFGIVLLYKYRCMKVLIGYMMFASTMILGFMSSVMFEVAIDRYTINVDKVTYAMALYNFAIVGTASIFVGTGFPRYITQFYLIMTSVIVAWQLSHFDDWTAWMLLVLLALYDLYAVLTPCGPLKALVNLMQHDDAPNMPGLLYEANIASSFIPRNNQNLSEQPTPEEPPSSSSVYQSNEPGPTTAERSATIEPQSSNTIQDSTDESPGNTVPATETSDATSARDSRRVTENRNADVVLPSSIANTPSTIHESQIGHIPLAIARLYQLPFHDVPENTWVCERLQSHPEDSEDNPFTASEMNMMVQVVFPLRGGRISEHTEQNLRRRTLYAVYGRNGDVKRVLYVKDDGKVYQREDESTGSGQDLSERDSIKLGLGDFIFYSILVSKAALYSFASFAACTLVILLGLGLTLVILAVKGQALPALPISIFLGVLAYILTRYVMEDFLEEFFLQSTYA